MMEQLSMFDYKETMSPLASRLRPESLETFVGQKHLLGKGKLLRQLIDQDQIPSMIFWGPPGVGKTTLASIIAKRTNADFVNFSAVTSGIKEIKEVMVRAELSRRSGLRTLVFVDEIHRLGAQIQVDGRVAVVEGVTQLTGAPVQACDLRAGAALVIAGLAAQGETELTQVQYIERGYEDLVGKLRQLGADIRVEEIPEPEETEAHIC